MKLIVLCSTLPDKAQPNLGIFVKNRMQVVGETVDLVYISPRAWSPFDRMIRKKRPHFRPTTEYESQLGRHKIYYPKFFSLPGLAKHWDAWFMARACRKLVRQLKQQGYTTIDAHFVYPDGYAASLLAQWLSLPFCITLRGTIISKSREPKLKKRIVKGLNCADYVVSVTQDLLNYAHDIGATPKQAKVIGNGIDREKIYYVDTKVKVRQSLNIPMDAIVLISVGGLIEHKGQHHVIQSIPQLIDKGKDVYYLVIGGASPAGNNEGELKHLIETHGLQKRVVLLGPKTQDELKDFLSAADLFVLPTRYEGWANVFLEAMSCGLPVITTRIGGNPEVVSHETLGLLYWPRNIDTLTEVLLQAIEKSWSKETIIEHTKTLSWQERANQLLPVFQEINQTQSRD